MYLTIAGIALVIIAVAALAGSLMSRVEEPAYIVAMEEGPIQIRDYKATIVAETDVAGERKAAISEGFRLLAALHIRSEQTQCEDRDDGTCSADIVTVDRHDGASHAEIFGW